jgi:serine/threonine protein phosphatase 1
MLSKGDDEIGRPVKTYCIGDVHGMADLLRRALAFIETDAGEEGAHVVFLGDYVDRGPDSKGVLDLLMAGPQRDGHRWTMLKGNHDDMMGSALAGDRRAQANWLHNGGLAALASFGLSPSDWDRVPEPYGAFLRERPLLAEDEHRIYVHAGLRPGIALERQIPRI